MATAQLEAAARDMVQIRGVNAHLTGELRTAMDKAEQNIEDVFKRVDDLLADLQAGDRSLSDEFNRKTSALEAAIQELRARAPAGATAGASAEAVGDLHVRLQQSASQIDQINNRLAQVAAQVPDLQRRMGAFETESGDPYVAAAQRQREAREGGMGGGFGPAQPPGFGGDAPSAPSFAGGFGPARASAPASEPAAAQQTSFHNIGTPGAHWWPVPVEEEMRPQKCKFDSKIAQNPLFKYNKVDPRKWCIKVSNYLVGECPVMSLFLQWCLDQQYSNITWDMSDIAKAEDPKVAMSDIA